MPRHFAISPYCVACRLRVPACVCALAPRLQLETRVVVVLHVCEWGRTANTGHLLRLAVQGADLRIHGLMHQPVSDRGVDAQSPSTLALFPGCGATPLTRDDLAVLPRPLTLLVPDGNWNQASHMMRRVPMLRDARPIRLEGAGLDFRSLRRNVYFDRRSTFESVAQALGLLEGPEVEKRMLGFFRHFLEHKNASHRQLAALKDASGSGIP